MNAPRDPATRADCPFPSCPTPKQCAAACRHNAARPVDTTTFVRPECPLSLCPTPSGCADACQHNARVAAYAAQQTKSALDDGWDWAIVEVFGHRSHAGRVREEERFGAKLLRIDIPKGGDPAAHGWETVYYGGASIFSFRPCTEAAALKINTPYAPPARYAITAPRDGEDEHGDESEEPF